jgi:hypothetical protein
MSSFLCTGGYGCRFMKSGWTGISSAVDIDELPGTNFENLLLTQLVFNIPSGWNLEHTTCSAHNLQFANSIRSWIPNLPLLSTSTSCSGCIIAGLLHETQRSPVSKRTLPFFPKLICHLVGTGIAIFQRNRRVDDWSEKNS